MTAQPLIPALPASGTRRWIWLLLLGFGGFVVVMVAVYMFRRKTPAKKASGSGANADGTPTNTGTSVPPETPPGSAPNVSQEYIEMLAWKFKATMDEGQDHGCEVTNGIIEMGETDLLAFMRLYENWYGKSLTDEYCQKMEDSNCWTSWWDGKKDQACERLVGINNFV